MIYIMVWYLNISFQRGENDGMDYLLCHVSTQELLNGDFSGSVWGEGGLQHQMSLTHHQCQEEVRWELSMLVLHHQVSGPAAYL